MILMESICFFLNQNYLMESLRILYNPKHVLMESLWLFRNQYDFNEIHTILLESLGLFTRDMDFNLIIAISMEALWFLCNGYLEFNKCLLNLTMLIESIDFYMNSEDSLESKGLALNQLHFLMESLCFYRKHMYI